MLLLDIESKLLRSNYLGPYCCSWAKTAFISLICFFCLLCDEGHYLLDSNQPSDSYFTSLYIEIKVPNTRTISFTNVRNSVSNRLFKSTRPLQLHLFKSSNGFLHSFIILKLDKKIRSFFLSQNTLLTKQTFVVRFYGTRTLGSPKFKRHVKR